MERHRSIRRMPRFGSIIMLVFLVTLFTGKAGATDLPPCVYNLKASLSRSRSEWIVRYTWNSERFGGAITSSLSWEMTATGHDRSGNQVECGGTLTGDSTWPGRMFGLTDWSGRQFFATLSLPQSLEYTAVTMRVQACFLTGAGETRLDPGKEVTIDLPPLDDDNCEDEFGNPINVIRGANSYRKHDLSIETPSGRLEVYRTYRSALGATGDGNTPGPVGLSWTFNYNYSLEKSGTRIGFRSETGKPVYFYLIGSSYVQRSSGEERIRLIDEADGSYTVVRQDGSRIHFTDTISDNADFLLADWMEDGKGRRITFDYSSYQVGHGVRVEVLGAVTDEWGNGFGFEHETAPAGFYDGYTGRIKAVYNLKSPENKVSYTYADSIGTGPRTDNPVRVDYPDGSSVHYFYEHPHDPFCLTRVEDETGKSAYYHYDFRSRALGEYREGDADRLTIGYDWHGNPWMVTITDSLDRARVYRITEQDNVRTKTLTGPGCCGSAGTSTVYRYDLTTGNRLEVENGRGIKKQYLNHDTWGNAQTIIEAAETAEARATNYTYDSNTNQLLKETKASVPGAGNTVTIYDYDDPNDPNDNPAIPNENPTKNLYKLIEKGFTRDSAGTIVAREYVTSYTYNAQNQIETVDGPRTDVNDATAYSYYPDDPGEGNNRAMFHQVMNALGHTVEYGDYEVNGKPGYVKDANKVITRYRYNWRGHVTEITVEGAGPQGEDLVTDTFYYADGDLNYIRLPGGSVIDYAYDGSGRLTSITRRIGPDDQSTAVDSMEYRYDSEGNKLSETLHEG